MNNSQSIHEVWEFAGFRLDGAKRTLARGGQPVALKSKEFELLCLLVGRHGEVVTKEEILAAVWGSAEVEESNLSVQISSLRKALGDSATQPVFIETLPRVGYRFVGNPVVSTTEAAPDSLPVVAPTRSRRWFWLPAAVLVGLVLIGLFWLIPRSGGDVSWNPQPLTSDPGVENAPALSPDGTQVLYEMLPVNAEGKIEPPGLFLKTLGAGVPTRVTSDYDMNPAWSPNGREFAYVHLVGGATANPRLQLVVRSSFGGAARVLHDDLQYNGPRPGPTVSFTPDGKWLLTSVGTGYFPGSPPRQLVAVARDTGEVRTLLEPIKGSAGDSNAIVSPKGDRLAFCRCLATNACDIYDVGLQGLTLQGKPRRLSEFPSPEMRPAYLPDGSLVYSLGPPDARGLWRTAFTWMGDVVTSRVSPLGDDTLSPTIAKTADGKLRLIYVRSLVDLNIWRASLTTPDGKLGKAEPLITSNRTEEMPAYAPDSQQVAFASTRSGMWEIWICRASDGQEPRQLTKLGPAYSRHPSWSPDGKWIAFGSRAKSEEDIFVVPAEGGEPRQITAQQGQNSEPVWSPDGRWLYFASNRTGRYEIYRIAAPPGSNRSTPAEPITSSGGSSPRLSPDGQTMYFRGPNLLYQRMDLRDRSISTQPKILSLVPPVPVTADLGYTIVRDGGSAILSRFDWKSGSLEHLLPVRFRRPAGLARSPDGRNLLFGVAERTEADLIIVDDLHF